MYILKFNPYKVKYFNVLALIDEVGVFLCTAVCSNFVFINSGMTSNKRLLIGFIFGLIVEIVLILNLVILYMYYFKNKNPDFEYELEVQE
jgi:hypothetical protein